MGVGGQMKCNSSSFRVARHGEAPSLRPLHREVPTLTTYLHRGPEVPADKDEVQLRVQSPSRVLGGEDDAVRMLPGRQ